jgi:hypothetical protein
MRNISRVAIIAFLAAMVPTGSRGQSSTWLSAGPTYVLGPASVWAGTGYNLQASRDFGHFGPAVFRADVLYMQRPGNGITRSSMTERTYAVAGSMLYRRPIGALAPFVMAGCGLYGDNSWATYTPGINAGVGIDASIARVRFFAESRIHQYLRDAREAPREGRGVTLVPISFGIRF